MVAASLETEMRADGDRDAGRQLDAFPVSRDDRLFVDRNLAPLAPVFGRQLLDDDVGSDVDRRRRVANDRDAPRRPGDAVPLDGVEAATHVPFEPIELVAE